MKTPSRPVTARPCPRRLLAGALLPLLALSASAATYYQRTNHNGSGDWSILSHWSTAATGTGTAPTAINATDDFVANISSNGQLRTPNAVATFGGGKLTVGPSNHTLFVRGSAYLVTIPNLVTLGAAQVANSYAQGNLSVTAWRNASGVTTLVNHTNASAVFNLGVGTLSGEGGFNLTSGSATARLRLTITDAEDYLGAITLSSGRLEFMNAFSSAGALVVPNPADVTLNHAVTFTGLTVAGTVYPVGTYAATSLGFSNPLGGGSVTVRPVKTWYLTTKQSSAGHNWTEAWLSHWSSQTTVGGVAPTSINVFDNYVSQAAGGELRTSSTASTFGGGTLTLANTTKLALRTPVNVVSTVPVLITAATPTIANGLGAFRQNLAVGDWEIASGSTKLSAGAGRAIGLDVGYLSGSGALRTQDPGSYVLKLHNGTGYTGTLDHAAGALSFEGVFSTRGAFTVGSAATVALDRPAYFTSFSVEGAAKSAGVHDYATLHGAHPLRFPAGSSAGLVGVYTPDTTGPAHMFGVNLAGAESRRTDDFPGQYGVRWKYPTEPEFDYYHSKGLNLIRIPFRWERMQPVRGGVLNADELDRMDVVVGYAAARGMKVILDMHNYARWIPGSNQEGILIGTGGVTIEQFAGVWRLLADHYKGNSAIYGYGIMNEPNKTNGTWPQIAQAAMDAIRTVDLTTYVIVGGDHNSNANGWRSKNPNLDIKDPVGRLIYEAHCYFDDDNSGTYDESYVDEGAYPEIGVDRVTDFIAWLNERGAKGFIGEYGVPDDNPDWLVALDKFLECLDENGISGTYWAGGPWWGNYPLSVEPVNGVDRPQMDVLEDY